jgi:hypothetical protein
LQTSDNNSSHQIVYNKIKEKKLSRVVEIAVVVWLVGVATTISGHAVELVPL